MEKYEIVMGHKAANSLVMSAYDLDLPANINVERKAKEKKGRRTVIIECEEKDMTTILIAVCRSAGISCNKL